MKSMNLRLKSPLNVQLEVTGDCTSMCVHCYNFWRQKSGTQSKNAKIDSFSEEDATLILNKLGKAEVFNLTITGGEPLMNFPLTLQTIKNARLLNMKVGLNSNLVLLSREKAELLKRAGLTHVMTSILGPTAEIHDALTQRKGSFRRLIAGIYNAHRAGVRVSANMVVSQLSCEHVIKTAKLIAQLGIRNFMATKAGCPGNCCDFSHLAINRQQLLKFLNDLCWIKENLDLNIDTLEPVPFCALRGVSHPEFFTSRRCNAGVTTATISYDGSVRPCPHLDISYGNLLTEDFSTVWERMRPWSDGFQVPKECSGCELLNVCGSGCRMEAKMNSGRINGPDPFAVMNYVNDITEVISRSRSISEKVAVRRFRTPNFRLRQEAFGGVFLSGKRHVFLDTKGFYVLSQLKPLTTYDLETMKIDWHGLDARKFISGLARRNAVSFV